MAHDRSGGVLRTQVPASPPRCARAWTIPVCIACPSVGNPPGECGYIGGDSGRIDAQVAGRTKTYKVFFYSRLHVLTRLQNLRRLHTGGADLADFPTEGSYSGLATPNERSSGTVAPVESPEDRLFTK
jgi:hypothetical protein